MRKRTSMFIVCMLLLIFIITAPLLAPIVHDDHSPKSAVRNYIQQDGHPYQNFFAIIRNTNTIDPQFGELYDFYGMIGIMKQAALDNYAM